MKLQERPHGYLAFFLSGKVDAAVTQSPGTEPVTVSDNPPPAHSGAKEQLGDWPWQA